MEGQLKEVNEDFLDLKESIFWNFLANLKKYSYLIIQYAFFTSKNKNRNKTGTLLEIVCYKTNEAA
jgi:hypothetical protein